MSMPLVRYVWGGTHCDFVFCDQKAVIGGGGGLGLELLQPHPTIPSS